MNTATAFGSKLREEREKKDISLRELAKRIGVSGAFLSDIELGRRFPSQDKVELLANEIGIPVEELTQYDFRDEADTIRQMMFADPKAGMVFRTLKENVEKGHDLAKLLERLSKTEE